MARRKRVHRRYRYGGGCGGGGGGGGSEMIVRQRYQAERGRNYHRQCARTGVCDLSTNDGLQQRQISRALAHERNVGCERFGDVLTMK